MKALRTALLSLMSITALACAGTTEPAGPFPEPIEAPGEVAASDQQRITASAPAADLENAVRGQTELALDLYRALGTDNADNLFLSPLSISVALSMAYAGAETTTEDAFETVLGSTLAEAAHHRAMNDLEAQLSSRGQGASGADGQPFRLNTVNQVFAKTGYPILAPFLDTLALEYGANLRLLDFENATEPSREAINDWVAQRTEDRIQNLLAPGTIRNDTRLVLVNAVYFNASWSSPFEPSLTAAKDFHTLEGSVKSVPFMKQNALPTRAAEVNGVEILELPYDGGELSMLVMMPPAGAFASFEAALDAATVESYIAALQGVHLNLEFPKFEVRTSANLGAPLSDLGLGVAFSDGADFSGITTQERLAITDVVHQSFVKVNEAGTEAAAATGVVFGPTSVPQTRDVKVDRPFVFAVLDRATNSLVFLGRITSP